MFWCLKCSPVLSKIGYFIHGQLKGGNRASTLVKRTHHFEEKVGRRHLQVTASVYSFVWRIALTTLFLSHDACKECCSPTRYDNIQSDRGCISWLFWLWNSSRWLDNGVDLVISKQDKNFRFQLMHFITYWESRTGKLSRTFCMYSWTKDLWFVQNS